MPVCLCRKSRNVLPVSIGNCNLFLKICDMFLFLTYFDFVLINYFYINYFQR